MENSSYTGLTAAQVKQRQEQGLINETNNNVSKTKKQIILTHTLTYFNFLNIFLGVIVICSGQIKNLTFLGVIIINSIIGIIQELKVKKLVDGLSVITASKVKVIRDSVRKEIPIDQLVMDDVMVVESGNQIGADSTVLSGEGIEVNESMITGESRPVKKMTGDTLWSGSYLVAGSGVAKVIHVGKDNYATELANKARDKKRATSEMQDSIKRIIKVIGFVIIPVGILLFLSQRSVEGTTLSDAMVNTVAGVIGMIPEGLVLLTSISFILGVGRLAVKRALVQEMEAIEALARVNVLCTDKTGTITTGELKVKDIVPLSKNLLEQLADDTYEESIEDDLEEKETQVEQIKTIMNEIAFAFNDVNSTQTALMNYFTKTQAWEIVDLIPFSSARKYRAISFLNHGAYVLGAPEFILKDTVYTDVLKLVEPYSHQGLRVLLLASAEEISSVSDTVTGIKPLGLILISDIIRTEAKATFDYFASQGVDVKVISGDNPATVSYIAVEAGLQDGEKYIDATQLPEDDAELRNVICDYAVFGRVTPEQKQRIIKAYQANDKVVGMVGDGVNDVLALKDADCGIAMAAGSDAAKQVAHIVLLDSDFACMQDIVREGRMIISNIERVSALYLTKTIYSVLLSVIFILIGRSYPFIPIHLSLISATAIGLPSFLLTLEQTETVTQNGFLKHVLRISLPGALTMVGTMLLNQLLAIVFGFDAEILSTYNLLTAGAISMAVLVYVCMPLNKKRKLLCIICVALFVLALLIAPGLFSITSLFMWRLIFVIPIIWLIIIVMKLLVILMRRFVK
ncbi:MAG TPA: HAD-IC family P-type ATPase [Candidatus Scybalocola faecipullorum]|nr:HAD-IC family P-type ATPase [Candidatus Scybalocola faecipullorum]